MEIDDATAQAWVQRLLDTLQKHALSCLGRPTFPYLNEATGAIDGYFDLMAVARDMLEAP